MKHDHRVNTPTSSPWFVQQTNRGGCTCTRTHICSHTPTSSRASTNPQHLFFIITIQSAGGKVGPCYTAAVCEVGCHWHSASDMSCYEEVQERPSGKPRGSSEGCNRRRRLSSVLCTHTITHTHKHKHIKDCMWHSLGFIWYDCNLACTRQ